MAHESFMNANQTSEQDIALRCTRLYLHGGKRRLQAGQNAAGIAALYDAVLFGMRYYIAKHKSCASFMKSTAFWDASALFQMLAQAGVFEDQLAFNRFSLLVERVLWQESFAFHADAILTETEKILVQLGVPVQ